MGQEGSVHHRHPPAGEDYVDLAQHLGMLADCFRRLEWRNDLDQIRDGSALRLAVDLVVRRGAQQKESIEPRHAVGPSMEKGSDLPRLTYPRHPGKRLP